jgi:uncharacterized membrane protein YphA (DoxX/SURF4 family)/thiol-disulfide isomerase/thioredoxin
MDDSMAQAGPDARLSIAELELPIWKSRLGTLSAILLAVLFLVAGIWKITDPLAAAQRMTQALIPAALSLPTAIGAGVVETFAAVLLLIPSLRRWGAWLCGLMLLAFMVYMGWNYTALQGEECNCFPWIKRAVGPGFFIGDAVMLAFAWFAGAWARPSYGLRTAAVTFGAITVFSAATFGIISVRESGISAPASVSVDGKPFPLNEGRVFLYFFDPECAHCDRAARDLAKLGWKDVKIVAVVTAQPQFGQVFVAETGLKAVLTTDSEALRRVFTFTDPPYGVALEGGRQLRAFPFFDAAEPRAGLKELGFIE